MRYETFWYNGRWSVNEDFKAYIIHENDLKFFNFPDFTNEFEFPMFGNSSLLTGVQKENKRMEFKILLKEITLKEYNLFLKWLDFDGKGHRFAFDYFEKDEDTEEPEKFFEKVKLESLSEGEFNVVFPDGCSSSETYYNIILNISFVTIGDWATRRNIVKNKEISQEGLSSYAFENKSILPSYFNITFLEGTTYLSYKKRLPLKEEEEEVVIEEVINFLIFSEEEGRIFYNSELGILQDSDLNLIFLKDTEEEKILKLEPGLEITFDSNKGIILNVIEREYI